MTIETWQELKALSNGQWPDDECMKAEIDELRAELTKIKAQEPVAFMDSDHEIIYADEKSPEYAYTARYTTPLYLAPGVQPVPEGMVLVPIEPTDELCEAAWECEGVDYVGEYKRIHRADLAYKAMLEAAKP